MFSSGPRYQKLSTNLRLSINRLKLLEKKNTELAVKARREISEYLAAGKEDRARIRVEHIIRDDYLVEAMEMVEMYCDLLLARMGLIQTTKELDEGLEEPIASVIWATPRLQGDVPELHIISEQLSAKYGKEFTMSCRSNTLDNVNEKLMLKLSVHAPPKKLVDRYLEEIARTYNVPFIAPPDDLEMGSDVLIGHNGMLINLDDPSSPTGGLPVMAPQRGMPTPQYPGGLPQPGMPTPQYQMPPVPADPEKPPMGGIQMPPVGGVLVYPVDPPAAGFNLPPTPPSYIDRKPPRGQGGSSGGGPSGGMPSAPGAKTMGADFELPDLPAVPTDTVPGTSSGGGSDFEFDDLTRRFEALRKKP